MKFIMFFAFTSFYGCIHPVLDCSTIDPEVIRKTYVDCLQNTEEALLKDKEVGCRISAQKLHCPVSDKTSPISQG